MPSAGGGPPRKCRPKNGLQLLNRQLKDQAADIKRLTGSVAAASAVAATAELHELRQQLSRAREESAKKDAHIEQLQLDILTALKDGDSHPITEWCFPQQDGHVRPQPLSRPYSLHAWFYAPAL